MGRYIPKQAETVSQESVGFVVTAIVQTAVTVIAVNAIASIIRDLKNGRIFAKSKPKLRTGRHLSQDDDVKDATIIARIERLTRKLVESKGKCLPKGDISINLLESRNGSSAVREAQAKLQLVTRLGSALNRCNDKAIDLAKRMDVDSDLINSEEHDELNKDMASVIYNTMSNAKLFGLTMTNDKSSGYSYQTTASTNDKSFVKLPSPKESGEILRLVAEILRAYSSWPKLDEQTEIFIDSPLRLTIVGENAVHDGCSQLLNFVEESLRY